MLRTGWIVERNGVHQGMGACGNKLRWVGFNDERLIVFSSEEAASNFLHENHLTAVGFVCEHGWYE